jgi:hypothetical protein
MMRVIHRPGLYTGGFDDAAEAICRLQRIEAALEHLCERQATEPLLVNSDAAGRNEGMR